MENFDIAKYLKEHQLGSYGILNHYIDMKPLKEEESEKDFDRAASAAGKSSQDIVDRLKKLGYSPEEIDKVLNKLKEVEVPYQGSDHKLTGMGDKDEFKQDETVSENEEFEEQDDRIMMLGGSQIEKGIISLLKDGFPTEDILELCDQLVALNTSAPAGYGDEEFEAPEWKQDRTQNREFYEGVKKK